MAASRRVIFDVQIERWVYRKVRRMDKEFILSEIARTAKENGGKALGRGRFRKETGIKDSDWLGKFWPRWSDAVADAGVEGSTWQTSLDESEVIEHYLRLTRDLGHVPVSAEIRMRATSEPGFPWHNTFYRFGGKAELLLRALKYCDEHDGWSDVAGIVASAKPTKAAAKGAAPSPEGISAGYVYLLRVGRDYKIGRTNAFDQRSRELAIQLPERHETVHVISTDDASGIEAYWHARFAAQRKNGEWFALSSEQVKAFKRRKFM